MIVLPLPAFSNGPWERGDQGNGVKKHQVTLLADTIHVLSRVLILQAFREYPMEITRRLLLREGLISAFEQLMRSEEEKMIGREERLVRRRKSYYEVQIINV